ncbi:hypothetical protein [Streptomyces sp. KR55]|uniref:hypothetical protein n=1 Tax=Streptomyces sp. KR55 TaxID=3457425 RepID=UPI003FD5E2D0
MVRKTSKVAGKPRPKRPPICQGQIKTSRIVNRLRELHELGGDPSYERFPAAEELFLVLGHAQTWAGKLKQPQRKPVLCASGARDRRGRLGDVTGRSNCWHAR